MSGNDQGLDFVDAMTERFNNLENKMLSMQNEIRSLKNQMAIIRSSGLLKYLTFEKQEDSYERNEIVHSGEVKFDLWFLKSVEKEFLNVHGLHGLQITEFENAFEKRYGKPHQYFSSKDFPQAIEGIINMKSALVHLKIWKDVDEQYVNKRNQLQIQCDRNISLWFDVELDLPYSIQDANQAWYRLWKEYDSTIVSIQHARVAKREGERE